jgi:cystathionine beta-synthase
MMKIAANILELIGNTPLVYLNRVVPEKGARIAAKLESFNPGGSVKDRIGLGMIDDAIARGVLKPGGTIIEPTSGNTGLGLALVANIKGFKMIAVMPDKVPKEKIQLLEAVGTKCVVCPTDVDPSDPSSYYETAKRLNRETPNSFLPQQYYNEMNPESHYRTTGPEIWRDTDGKLDVYVAGVGTGGTISGTGKYLKEKNPKVKVVGVDTVGSVIKGYFETKKIEGYHPYLIDGIGEDFIPGNIKFEYIDEIIPISDKYAYDITMRLAREESILVGSSSGAAVAGAIEVAKRMKPDQLIVVLLPDTGTRYLSKLNNDWLHSKGLI